MNIVRTTVNATTRKLKATWVPEDPLSAEDNGAFMEEIYARAVFDVECEGLYAEGWIILKTLDDVPDSWVAEHISGEFKRVGKKFAFRDTSDVTFFAISWRIIT